MCVGVLYFSPARPDCGHMAAVLKTCCSIYIQSVYPYMHMYILRMRKRNSKHCHVAGAHIEQSLIDRDFHSGGKKEMDPKLMIEINEKRKYVLESRQDRDGGIKYFMLHWKPHSELLLKPQLLRKPCISTYF